MADESAPVATPAPAPVSAPAAQASKSESLIEGLRELVKPSKREKEAELKAKAEAKGANTVLKGLGVKKSDRARMIEEIKEGRLEIAKRREETAAALAVAATAKQEVDKTKAEASALTPYVELAKRVADQEFAALPESFQKSLADMKIEEPLARMEMISIWKKNGVISGAAAAPKADPKAPNPATTMAVGNPAAAKTGATLNHYEQWQALRSAGDKMGAAAFRKQFAIKIDEQTPTK
jgi:hypothetical protein